MIIAHSPDARLPEPADVQETRLAIKNLLIVFMVLDSLVIIFGIVNTCLAVEYLGCLSIHECNPISVIIVGIVGLIVTVCGFFGFNHPDGPASLRLTAVWGSIWFIIEYGYLVGIIIRCFAFIPAHRDSWSYVCLLLHPKIVNAYLAFDGILITVSAVRLCLIVYALILFARDDWRMARRDISVVYVGAPPQVVHMSSFPMVQMQPVGAGEMQPFQTNTPISSGPDPQSGQHITVKMA